MCAHAPLLSSVRDPLLSLCTVVCGISGHQATFQPSNYKNGWGFFVVKTNKTKLQPRNWDVYKLVGELKKHWRSAAGQEVALFSLIFPLSGIHQSRSRICGVSRFVKWRLYRTTLTYDPTPAEFGWTWATTHLLLSLWYAPKFTINKASTITKWNTVRSCLWHESIYCNKIIVSNETLNVILLPGGCRHQSHLSSLLAPPSALTWCHSAGTCSLCLLLVPGVFLFSIEDLLDVEEEEDLVLDKSSREGVGEGVKSVVNWMFSVKADSC